MDRRSKDHLTTTVTNIRDYQTRKVSYTVGGLITPFQSSQRALAVRGPQASRDGTSPPPAQGRALTLRRTVKARAAHLWEPVMAVLSLTCSNARIVTSTLPSCSIISIARARQHLRRLHRLHPTSTTGLRWPYHWHLKQPTNHTMYDTYSIGWLDISECQSRFQSRYRSYDLVRLIQCVGIRGYVTNHERLSSKRPRTGPVIGAGMHLASKPLTGPTRARGGAIVLIVVCRR